VLVLDWDGTVTETDSLWMLLDRFGDREIFARVEGELTRGEVSYKDLMEREFRTVQARLGDVQEWLAENVRVRAGFHELAAAHHPVVLSSGFEETIRPVLEREGVQVQVVANRLDPRPDGWRVVWRDETVCATCGDLCKRASLPGGGRIVYVGDGYSDRCAAEAANRIFARDGLAEYLRGRGVPFEPFDDLHDVAAALERPSGEISLA
jgi:2-hydroxy-3-keto-5-methylthiopentenyl-1-phosphate phosphatase